MRSTLSKTRAVIVFWLAMLCTQSAAAQDMNFTVSSTPDYPSDFSYPFIIRDSLDCYMVTQVSRGKIHLAHLGENLALVNTVEVEIDRHATIVELMVLENEIACFYTINDFGKSKKDLYVDLFSKATLGRTLGAKKLAQIYYTVKTGTESAVFHFIKQNNDAGVLVYDQTPDAPSNFHFLLFDRNFVLKKTLIGDFSVEDKSLQDWSVTMQGNGFIAFAGSYRRKATAGTKWAFYLNVLDTATRIFKHTELPMSIDDPELFQLTSNKNTILCYHFTKDIVYIFRYMIQSGQLIRAELRETDIKAKARYFDTNSSASTAEQSEEQKKNRYFPYHVVFREDGSVFIAGEQAYEKEDMFGARHYRRDNIQLLEISPSNEIAWVTRIVKDQWGTGSTDPYVSFALITTKDNEYLMLNDYHGDRGNLLRGWEKISKKATFLIGFDDSGRPETKTIFSADAAKAYAIPTWYGVHHSGWDSVVIPVGKGLYKIEFN